MTLCGFFTMRVMIKKEGMVWEVGRSFWITYKAGRALTFFGFYRLFNYPRLLQILGRKYSWNTLKARPHQRQLQDLLSHRF